MKYLPALAGSFAHKRTWPSAVDVAIFATAIAAFYALIGIGRYWWGAAVPKVDISLSAWALPGYALYSVVRLFAAYGLSLLFAIGYGYAAANSPRLEKVLIAILDVLQSIPVLSFLPGVMLATIALFPSRQLGVEIGSILLIFTGQVWNMAFSFYSSLKAIPPELREASQIYSFNRWQRFRELELPYGAIGLIWNSMVSVAGGWFFLMACEMFVLGKRDFRLPGLGSYLQTAAGAGDIPAMVCGIGAMIAVIVLTDFLLWRPLIAWSNKFKFEQVESAPAPRSTVLDWLRRSHSIEALGRTLRPGIESLERRFTARTRVDTDGRGRSSALMMVLAVAALAIAGYGMARAGMLVSGVARAQWLATLGDASITFLRVNAALAIACLWTIPAGVAIASNPRLARIAQPLAQIAASVPATALFPIILLALIQAGGGLGIASILLMLLGTQWYILFNVIAGALAIPSELKEVGKVFRFDRICRWRTIILPGIFPYLVTGLVTASGGAWNASIVAEYFHLNGRTYTTAGLGARIASASDAGQFDVLLLSTVIMAAMVVCVNRLVWRPMYRLAETRYRMEG